MTFSPHTTSPVTIQEYGPNQKGIQLPDGHATWKKILRHDPCAYCGDEGGTVDHIIPRRGDVVIGHEYYERYGWHMNLTGACARCNSKKETTSLLKFMLDELT